jgi:alkylation response protein AidB-like acyl-CoA dehydrogenase
MPQELADRRDIDFNLYELFQAENLCDLPVFKEYNRKVFDLIVSEARNFAIKEMLPTYEDGDKIGVSFDAGTVKVPESFRRVYKLYCESEWTAPPAPQEYGGQGLPFTVTAAIREYMMAANWPLHSYASMGSGTARMIQLYGSDAQKKTYLEKLYTGQWGGTMLLTEPEAGTDVGALTTTAVKNDDGTYSLTGNKIFITNGEHDLAENIIHPVLARIEGDPPGTKGISIFIVPKFLVNGDGRPGERNDIVCTGVEEKHGIHGSATCAMSLGSKNSCIGYLLGDPKQGMKIMFHMMNGARLSTGLQALAYASRNYLSALNYARQRIQGRDLKDFANHAAPSVPIICHPDIRRNLLWMKAYTEGLRSMVYFISRCMDLSGNGATPEERQTAEGLVDLFTPIIKGYGADRGYEVCVQAMQVYGGAGYTQDYPVEAITRDCKIASIYEGCTGIQAMDLLGRKLGQNKGASFMSFMQHVQQAVALARTAEELAPLADTVEKALNRLAEIALGLGKMARSEKMKVAFAHSVPFMEAMGDVSLGWLHLWRAAVAAPKVATAKKKKDRAFYTGQVKTAAFFINTILPVTMGKLEAIALGEAAAVEMPEEGYGGL